MKRSRKLGFIAIVIILLSLVVYLCRIRILASVWHFRNGYTLAVADYVVPVPADWYPKSAGNRNKLLVKLDTRSPRLHGDRSPGTSILLLPERQVDEEQIKTMFSQEEAFLKRKGTDNFTSRAFDITGEKVICMGGDQLESNGIHDVNPTTWHCMSTGGLDIHMIASGADLPQAWDIITHIQKR